MLHLLAFGVQFNLGNYINFNLQELDFNLTIDAVLNNFDANLGLI